MVIGHSLTYTYVQINFSGMVYRWQKTCMHSYVDASIYVAILKDSTASYIASYVYCVILTYENDSYSIILVLYINCIATGSI